MLNGTFKNMLIETHVLNLNDGDYIQLNKIGYFYKKTIENKIILVEVNSWSQ